MILKSALLFLILCSTASSQRLEKTSMQEDSLRGPVSTITEFYRNIL